MTKRSARLQNFKTMIKNASCWYGDVYKKVLERDQYQCVLCYKPRYTMVHHLDGNRKNNVMDNLITVCKCCHSELHGFNRTINTPVMDEIIKFRNEGRTYEEIGDHYAISRQRVEQIVKNCSSRGIEVKRGRPQRNEGLDRLDKVCYYIPMYTRKLILLTNEQAEQLRKMAYINHTSQAKVIRDAFDFYITNPPKETK